MGKKIRKHKKTKNDSGILANHKKEGDKLIPPLIAKHGDIIFKLDWIGQYLPDTLLIALLIDEFGERMAIKIAGDFIKEAESVLNIGPEKSLAFVSGYYDITNGQGKKIRANLGNNGLLDNIQLTIYPLVSLYNECPLNILFDERALEKNHSDIETSLATLKRVVKNNFIRRDREAMITQTALLYLLGLTRKFTVSANINLGNLNAMFEYPETEEAREVAASVRASLNGLYYFNRDKREIWCRYFWRHGYSISSCEIFERRPIPFSKNIESPSQLKGLLDIAYNFRGILYKEIIDFWNRLPIDLSNPSKDEVLGGLIARQARLTTAIASEPNLCSLDIGRILMRCLVDGHITLAWLSKKGEEKHFAEFVEYGYGQEKLLTAHLKKIGFKEVPYSVLLERETEFLETYQSYLELNVVKLGPWAKKNARQMAEEADCIDIYNLAYTRLSASVHGTWNEIYELNLRVCANPLHRIHRVLNLEDPDIYLGIIPAAVEIMIKSLDAWAEAYGWEGFQSQACFTFREKIKNLFAEWRNKNGEIPQ